MYSCACFMFSPCVLVSSWRPYLDEAHPNGTHLGKLIDGLKAVVDWLGQKLSKLLVVENLEATSTGDLADSGGVEAVVVITVTALDKNAGVTEALCVHLPAHIVQVHSWSTETDNWWSAHSKTTRTKWPTCLFCCATVHWSYLCRCACGCSQLSSYGWRWTAVRGRSGSCCLRGQWSHPPAHWSTRRGKPHLHDCWVHSRQ